MIEERDESAPRTAAAGRSRSPLTGGAVSPGAVLLTVLVALVVGWRLDDGAATPLGLAALALVVMAWPSRFGRGRWGLDASARSLLVGTLALCALVVGTRDDLEDLLGGEVRAWNVYHYYLGSKYFPELGYHDLYRATLAADAEGRDRWRGVAEKVRNLETYELGKREELEPYQPREHFTEARWSEFRADVAALAEHRDRRAWKNVFRDRGYNGTPVWTTMGRVLASTVSADSKLLTLLCSVDLALLGLTAWVVWRTFGSQLSILVLALFTLSPFNVARLVGGLMQTGWLCALVCGLCFYQQRRPVLAGVLVALATALRGFPIVFPLVAMVPPLWSLGRATLGGSAAVSGDGGSSGVVNRLRRSLTAAWSGEARLVDLGLGLRYAVALAVVGLTLGVVGTVGNGRGLDGWTEFREAISLHGDHHRLGDRRVGLEHAFTLPPGAWLERGVLEEVPDEARSRHLAVAETPLWVVRAALTVLALLVAVRMRSAQAQMLAVVLVFANFVLSRYYLAILALLPLAAARRRATARWLTVGQLAVFSAHHALVVAGADWHASYAITNWALCLYLFAGLVALAGPGAAWMGRRTADGAEARGVSARGRVVNAVARSTE